MTLTPIRSGMTWVGWNEGSRETAQEGYVQVVVVLHREQHVALQQRRVVVVDLGRPAVLFEQDHVLQHHHRLRLSQRRVVHPVDEIEEGDLVHELELEAWASKRGRRSTVGVGEHAERENHVDEEAETLLDVSAAVVEEVHLVALLVQRLANVLELARDDVDHVGLRVHLRWRRSERSTSRVTLKVIKLRNLTLARMDTKMREKKKSRRKRKKDFTEGL